VALAFPFPVRRWIERRPVLVVAAAAIFATVLALREMGVEADGLALVCLVSIALVALEFGPCLRVLCGSGARTRGGVGA
jgi:hypothetical protein